MIALIALFTALAAVGAFIKIPIGTVPVTLQFAFCNLAMLLLGVKWGTLSIGLYVILGLVGVPVFTLGGGFSYVLQPTFGYILGFVAGCFLGGLICSRGTMGLARRLVASFVNLAVVYVIGVLYLGLIMKFYLGSEVDVPHIIVAYGLVFIPTDGLWAVLSSLAAPRLIPYIWGKDSPQTRRLNCVDGYRRIIESGKELTPRQLQRLAYVPLSVLCDGADALASAARATAQKAENIDTGAKNHQCAELRSSCKFKELLVEATRLRDVGCGEVIVVAAAPQGARAMSELRRKVAAIRFALPSAKIIAKCEGDGAIASVLIKSGADCEG